MRAFGLNLLVGLFISSLVFSAGCSSSTEVTPPEAVATTAPAPAPAATTYRAGGTDDEGPAFAHVKLPEVTKQPNPTVVLHTSQGDIKLLLNAEKAPRTVYNFVTYVNNGHYRDTIFHQVEKGYALLGGGFTEDLVEKDARYAIPSEANNGLKNKRGAIAMARRLDDPDSATCQFIINLSDNAGFDHQGDEPDKYGFCVFGQVVDGWDTLERIASVEVKDTEQFARLPVTPVKINSVQTFR